MPVMLADFGGLFAIGFLLISFIGWIINLINAQNPPPAPNRGPQRRPQARDRKVQNEIEEFLQEAMGNKRRPPEEVGRDEIEVIEPAPQPQRRPPGQQRQRPPARAGTRPERARAPIASATPQERSLPAGGATSRQFVPSQLGRSVASPVQQQMGQRVGQATELHLPHAVDQSVAQHLGAFTADDHDPRSSVKPFYQTRANIADPAGFLAELRSPAGMRKAILLQEILSKPRLLRR